MDTAEDLPRFEDPPRRAVAHLFKRPAPRPIDARQPKDMQRQPQRRPFRLGPHPRRTPRRRRGQRRGFIDPVAVVVPVNRRGGQIARPMQPGLGDLRPQVAQDRITLRVRRNAGQKMRRLPQRVADIPRPDQRLDPGCRQPRRLVRAARRADHPPALRDQPPRQRLRRIAVTNGQAACSFRPYPRSAAARQAA